MLISSKRYLHRNVYNVGTNIWILWPGQIDTYIRPDMVAHACNPSTLGGWGGWIAWGQEFDPAWETWWNPISTKYIYIYISWVWWYVPGVPATQEGEVGGLLQPWRRRLQWAKIIPLHSNLHDRVRHCHKNKQNTYISLGLGKIIGSTIHCNVHCLPSWVWLSGAMAHCCCPAS